MSDHRVYRIGPGGLPPGEHDAETDEGWSMAKLRPFETGLPMTVWITENDHYPHDVRVKVSTIHGGRGSWRHDALFVAVRPQPRELVPGILPAADLRLVSEWIRLNHDTIIDFWDGKLSVTELPAHLRKPKGD